MLRVLTLLTSCSAPLALRRDGVSGVSLSSNRDRLLLETFNGNSSAPEQVHLALAQDSQGRREAYAVSVCWLTWEYSKSEVVWGRTEALGEAAVVGNAMNYTTRHTNRHLPEVTSGYLHSVILENLEPSTTFFYRVGDRDLGVLSAVRNFTTPGAPGLEQPIVIGILGDLGQTNDSRNTLNGVLGHQPAIDLVLHAGDLSYADCHQERWDSFLRLLDPVASHIPWMVAAGNHEIEAGTVEGGPFAAFEHRFRMPSSGPAVRRWNCGVAGGLDGDRRACGPGLNDLLGEPTGISADADADNDTAGVYSERLGEAALRAKEAMAPDGGAVVDNAVQGMKCCPSEWSGTYDYGNSFYSFDVASVHVVVLNPYTATGEGSLQHSWLIEDLDATDRSVTPWLVAMFHCPWYNSNLKAQGERMAVTAMKAMEPVLFQHRASLAIAGHVHAYERSLPVFNGELNHDGLVHLVVGNGGNKEGPEPDYYRAPEWSAFRNGSVFGFGTLSIFNSTTALWEWKSNGGDAVVADSAWISNKFYPD